MANGTWALFLGAALSVADESFSILTPAFLFLLLPWLSRAAIKKQREPRGFKQHKCILPRLWRPGVLSARRVLLVALAGRLFIPRPSAGFRFAGSPGQPLAYRPLALLAARLPRRPPLCVWACASPLLTRTPVVLDWDPHSFGVTSSPLDSVSE